MNVFHLWWWQYIFGPIRRSQRICDRWWWVRVPWCRAKGHERVVWFNPGGLEPDMHCQNCGDDLG
jgi:hypothetical protein